MSAVSKSVFVVSGSTTLANALGIIKYLKGNEPIERSFHLLIGGLGTGSFRTDLAFANQIAELAERDGSFNNIVVVSTKQLTSFRRFSDKVSFLVDTMGIVDVAEVYVTRNWQLINEVVLAGYPEATPVCIGDGYGVVDLGSTLWQPFPYNPAGYVDISSAILFRPVALPDSNRSLQDLDTLIIPDDQYLQAVWMNLSKSSPLMAEEGGFSHSGALTVVALGRLAITGGFASTAGRWNLMLESLTRFWIRVMSALGLTIETRSLLVNRNLQFREASLYRDQILREVPADSLVVLKRHPRDFSDVVWITAKLVMEAGRRVHVADGIEAAIPVESWIQSGRVQKLLAFFSSTGMYVRDLVSNEGVEIKTLVDQDLLDSYQVSASESGGVSTNTRPRLRGKLIARLGAFIYRRLSS